MSKFVRPENLKFPTIYREFSSKREKLFNFRVQELPEEYFDEAIDLIVKHFMPEETFCVAHGYAEDDEIRHIMIDFYRKLLDRKLSIGCFCDGSVQLIAVNVMETKYSQREKLKVTFSNTSRSRATINFLFSFVVFKPKTQ